MYITHKESSMSDLLLSATNINQASSANLLPQDPMTQIMSIVQNPMSMFTGLGGAGGSPFMPTGDFGGGNQATPLDQLALMVLSASQTVEKLKAGLAQQSQQVEQPQQQEQQAAPQFPLPEEGKPKGDEPIDAKYKNADGSTKSAEQIIKESPAAANFCKTKGDAKEIYDNSKEKFGDWENEKDPEKAARSAIKFRQLAEFADNASSKDGKDRGEEANNGNINGFTKDFDVRNGTEGAIMADYFRKGRQFIVDTHGDGVNTAGHLSATKDKYVRQDGSTRSDAGQVFVDIGNGISHVIPGLGNVIAGAADGIDRGAQKGDIGGAILGGLKGGVNGAVYTASNALSLMDPTDPAGMVDGAKNLFGGGFGNTL
jgi:hypothetical protein